MLKKGPKLKLPVTWLWAVEISTVLLHPASEKVSGERKRRRRNHTTLAHAENLTVFLCLLRRLNSNASSIFFSFAQFDYIFDCFPISIGFALDFYRECTGFVSLSESLIVLNGRELKVVEGRCMDRYIDFSCKYVCVMCYWGVKIDPGSRMSTEKKAVSVRDLAEEAKKRIVFLIICVVGLSYLMSCKFWVFCFTEFGWRFII